MSIRGGRGQINPSSEGASSWEGGERRSGCGSACEQVGGEGVVGGRR